ncbi:uncharacterized protein DUF4287 [Chitinophaga skermanii]|uniref:Uncharacterized protein DUF4287 n=1 Tax=Chitinophaga skermanii TaxID=331697 RepID=A0A327QVW0_9BACT|nr:DUF4287 domain-containing protein [Chitinophaga skermanii]RAJ08729.1 uncharacterized protein DUF4287 [Chitinophaga skermanii]
MSFQAYLDNIEKNTGKTIAALVKQAEQKKLAVEGKLAPGVKAGDIVSWLKTEYKLGHGHAMGFYAYLTGKRA